MKNIIIVSKAQNAVAVGDNGMADVVKNAVGTFLPNLEVIKEILMAIPTEPSETTNIYISDVVQGLVYGSAIEYVKTGKTGSGKDLSQEEIAGFAEIYKLYAERILNVRFFLHKYIAKDNKELQELKRKAWDSLNSNSVQQVIKTEVVDPDKAIREAIDAQMIKALDAGEFDKYKELKAMRDELKPAETITVQGAVTTGANLVKTPTFSSDADKAMEQNEVENGGEALDENGAPIDFGKANGEKQVVKW